MRSRPLGRQTISRRRFSSLLLSVAASRTQLTRLAGGAFYNASGIQAVGVADLANSLAVIEKLVFEARSNTRLEDIANACATNFEGQESYCARGQARSPAFGNDDPLVDELANRVASLFDRCVSRVTRIRAAGAGCRASTP